MDAALHNISEFNRVLFAADAKVGLLLTGNGVALTGLVTTMGRTSTNPLVNTTAAVLAVSFIVCMGYLAMALRPDLSKPGDDNWFCFPAFPASAAKRPTPPDLADQAWQQAAALAEVARRKYRRFEVALRWSAVSSAGFLTWFTMLVLRATA